MKPAQRKYYFRLLMVGAIILVLFFIMFRSSGGVNPPIGSGNHQKVLAGIKLPSGFKFSLYASSVKNARSMTVGDKGTLFVGTRNAGNVYAVVDKDGDRVGETVYTIASNLYMPCGVAFKNGSLYVAEVNRVLRYDNIEDSLASPPMPVVINDSFPDDAWHGWKFVRFGPDGKLYVPVGAPCNVCDQQDPRYASIMRMNSDGTELEIFARGIRNTVGFDWHPLSQDLWFTENGRDWMGDDLPPDELNHAPAAGMHFGFPYFHGNQIPDPVFGKGKDPAGFTACAMELGPHVAAIGMRFYTGNQFPEEYRDQIFIAEHGSWNRSSKIGYRISLVKLKNGEPQSYETFASGFMQDQTVYGRPADVEVLDDGSILISDDYANAIYRVSYSGDK